MNDLTDMRDDFIVIIEWGAYRSSHAIVLGLQGLRVEIEICRPGHDQCLDKPACMIIMTMTEHDGVNSLNRDFQLFDIVPQGKSLARIKQELLPVGLNENSNPVLSEQAGAACRIFNQLCNIQICNHIRIFRP